MKKRTILLFSFVSVSTLYAQEVISTQGDTYQNANGSIDFTIGEPVIATVTNGNYDLTQGFQQTNWNFAGVEDHQPDYEATVFPNPMESQLHVKTNDFNGVRFVMYDANGQVVNNNELTGEITAIEVNELTPGAYNLVLIDVNENYLKTFKLIKHQ